ncbi:MAG: UDP-N-acetylmuramate--L-alanine ligase [Chloroflexi bacterium RBG_13_68_17]|jgi:UDP-N-acetylmuramate--alanine ligase|nr:MAG: UDP-N-acetylmuramate--L-alanine ligase [Chloroflexi bacterium RBG_13_68_17]
MSRRVHLVGIGGAGLSAIARILVERGEIVSGSDQAVSPYAEALAAQGVHVAYGHRAENVAGADLVIVSSAVPDTNPEVAAARQAGARVVRRSDYLGELTAGYQTVAVAGTHGKTTTTGLIAWLLDRAGRSPTFIVGGILEDFGTNARLGHGQQFVIEADEYDRAFLALRPSLAVVTNVEHDHPDCYPTPEDFRSAFREFAGRVEGTLIVCAEDAVASSLQPASGDVVRYGFGQGLPWRAEEIRDNAAGGSDFLAVKEGVDLGLVRTRLAGTHNVLNSLAALAAVDRLGIPFVEARQALTEFHGARRRFEVLGEASGVTVIDDYAHHPTEIRATLAAARHRFRGAEIWAVFQPHTFSRTRALLADFAQAFADADHVLVTEIFASREAPDPGINGARVAERIQHADVRFVETLADAASDLDQRVKAPAVVVTLSAGDGNEVGRMLLRARTTG